MSPQHAPTQTSVTHYMNKPVLFAAAGLGPQVGPGSHGKPSMLLAAREFDEYEEDTRDDSDEIAEEDADCNGGEAPEKVLPEFLSDETDETDALDPRYAKYGIGAQLMLKMGFQPGHGLGKLGGGIAEPIKISKRPSKSGVGAVPENSPRRKYDSASSLETRPANLFELIQNYESQGVQVPRLFKEVCDNGESAQVSTAIASLKIFAENWLSTKAQLQSQEGLVSIAETEELQARAELAASENVISAIESCVAREIVDAECITHTLEVLTQPACDACPDRMDAFASLADTQLSSLVSEALRSNAQAMGTLLKWSNLCRTFADVSLSTSLCAYDLALYAHVYGIVQNLLDDAASLLEVVELLIEQPIFVDTVTAVQTKLTQDVILPWLHSLVEPWQPFLENPPLAIIENMAVLSPDGTTFVPLVQKVADKYVAALEQNIVDEGSVSESMTCLERWRLVFSSSDVPDNTHIALLRYICERITMRTQISASPTTSSIVRVLRLANEVLDTLETILVLEFCLFNPWVVQARQRMEKGQIDITWMKSWVTVFLGICAAIPLIVDICEWYVNAFLEEVRTSNPWPLPTLHDASRVSTNELIRYLTSPGDHASAASIGAAGEATALYSTQFKDVLSHHCSLHNIECTATKETSDLNGQSLFLLKWPDGRSGFCYIEENVAFVSKSRTGKFLPTSLNHLQEWST